MRPIDPLDLTPLTLGAAALGQRYGLSNPHEPMTETCARAVLDRARAKSIRAVDTAPAYGIAEQRIGRWIKDRGVRQTVISKAPSMAAVDDARVSDLLKSHAERSRRFLYTPLIDGYLLHRSADWCRPAVRASLRRLQDQGVVGAIGLSGYDATEINDLITIERPDLIQLPFSLFDRRAESSGLLDRATDAGIVVFARSVYLQGLLFMDPANLPPYFRNAKSVLERLRHLAAEADCDLDTMAILGALKMPGISSVVVGLVSPDQVDRAVASVEAIVDEAIIMEAVRIGTKLPDDICDPRLWPTPSGNRGTLASGWGWSAPSRSVHYTAAGMLPLRHPRSIAESSEILLGSSNAVLRQPTAPPFDRTCQARFKVH